LGGGEGKESPVKHEARGSEGGGPARARGGLAGKDRARGAARAEEGRGTGEEGPGRGELNGCIMHRVRTTVNKVTSYNYKVDLPLKGIYTYACTTCFERVTH